ncbi:hypothetical protein JCM24511_00583 [Saitozyma sp. JCM 24511]|nr:hypothetical protein JCM24511_00583 [Saitozyma sp. JCM 24511]
MSSMSTYHHQTLPPPFTFGVLDRSSTAPQAVASHATFQRRPAGRTARSRPARPPALTIVPLRQRAIPPPPTASSTDSPAPAKRRRTAVPATGALTTSPLRNCDPSTVASTTPVSLTSRSYTPRSQEHNQFFGPTLPPNTPSAAVASHYRLIAAVQSAPRDTVAGPWVTNDLLGGVFGVGPVPASQEQHLSHDNFDFDEFWWQFTQPQHLEADKTGTTIMDPGLAEALYLLENHQFC